MTFNSRNKSSPPLGHGFSLVEIVLALGVISFAMVGIMGMLPVALRVGLESQRETRATHIAQSIFSDLKASPSDGLLIVTRRLPDGAMEILNPKPKLTESGTFTIYFDETGQPVGTGLSSEGVFGARISIQPNDPLPGLSHVEVEVFAPVQVTRENRSNFQFTTFLRH